MKKLLWGLFSLGLVTATVAQPEKKDKKKQIEVVKFTLPVIKKNEKVAPPPPPIPRKVNKKVQPPPPPPVKKGK